MTRLVFVRHGEAQSFVDRVIGGTSCTGLSDLGRRQAEALRDRLARTGELEGATAVYSSTLARAVQTAEIIRPAVGDVASSARCELCELHVDEQLDGRSWDQFEASYEWPPLANPYRGWTGGAEAWADFNLRIGRELDRISAEHEGETVVISCHGGVIANAMQLLGDLPLRAQFRMHIDNTSLTEWELRPAGVTDQAQWTLLRFNDAAHLAGLA